MLIQINLFYRNINNNNTFSI